MQLSNCIRFLSIDMVEKAKSGHPGMPMGMADVITVLFKDFLRFHPKDPKWSLRDRLVLSGGHGSALLYSVLYLTGYDRPTIDDLKSFRQLHSPCAGHPEFGHLEGIETTTGPLGQGIGNGVGMAIGLKKLGLSSKVYITCGDGDLMEGISHEACSLAGHLNLNNLIILYDNNKITIDGPTDLSYSDDAVKRFEAYGFEVMDVDGHDKDAIHTALTKAQNSLKPLLISCKTIIAKGAPTKAGTCGAHGSPLGAEEIQKTREALNWPHAPFDIPGDLLETWRSFYKRNLAVYKADAKSAKEEIDVDAQLSDLKKLFHDQKLSLATRQASGEILNTLNIDTLIGGSADLTPSNNTKTKIQKPITRDDFSGSYLYYGVREHAMGAIMNGLSLMGFKPYGGTFLAFADYMRPAIRLSAIMEQSVVYVMTHDSIGLGEDGTTHQPIEHLASLRAMPNLLVFRPCDSAEVLECWSLALAQKGTPSILALSRQNLPYLRSTHVAQNLCAKGAYIISPEEGEHQITLISTGSEVHLCVEAQKSLKGARVVSMPCKELFEALSEAEQESVIGKPKTIVVVEAGCSFGWEGYLNHAPKGHFIGINTFGASAKAEDLFKHFGITVEDVVNQVLKRF